ncbi:MAG: hypothetical protein EU539_03460 [Promethearchaeota archaeon]|nr:MAG: hypothetical protein EU539_03460 [Candidatus Lokiarchaeota archaeon]
MVFKIKQNTYTCPFCGNSLATEYSKCFNIYCQGQRFDEGNLVIYRLNPKLGIGRIIKRIEVPASRTLDAEDTFYIIKFKVLFENNIAKIIHPIDLLHKVFKVNEKIVTKRGIGVVNSQEFLIENGHISYEILFFNGKLEQVSEEEIFSTYQIPIKNRILTQKVDAPQHFLLKYWANLFHSYYTSYQIKCITNSRLSFMPHQINIAYRLSEEFFPRIILADEVGLGKTIEAGIYVKEMMARNLVERVLIVVPASLIKQWQFEMNNKFNIDFKIYDGNKIKEINKKSPDLLHNPFYYDNLIITSLQFARNPKYAELLSQIAWDIVIFDEAHHLRRYLINAETGNYRETRNYSLARNISKNCESLLLLTATPLQLHSFEIFSLIELIHPEAFENYSDFEHFRKNMPFINLLATNLNQIENLNKFELKNNIKLLKRLGYVKKSEEQGDVLKKLQDKNFRGTILEKLEKNHTLSKYLIRNRKKNVFPEEYINKRIVNTIMVLPKKEEIELYNEIRLYLAKIYNSSMSKENLGIGFVMTTLQKMLTSSKYAISRSIERRLEHIENLKSLMEEENESLELEYDYESLNGDLDEEDGMNIDLQNQEKILREYHQKLKDMPYDTKADRLLELIHKIKNQNSQEKILLFTQFVDTLLFLKEYLSENIEDINIQLFFGGMDKDQKDDAVEKFRSSSNFSVLLSTEVGGEGRNFQFCRVLVNYDLPWNPMKLEQRIGRLDRIGQESREIYIYNFFIENTIETDIVFALNKRINLFEESIGLLEPIIGKIEKDIKAIIFSENDGQKRKKLNEFYRNLDEQIKKAKEIEMQLDDMMIDKKSFQIDSLISSLASCHEVKLTHDELFLFVKYFFNLENHEFGLLESIADVKKHKSIRENSQVRIELHDDFKKQLDYRISSEYTGTFDIELAREKEEIDFFALGHPLINAILDFCRTSNFNGISTILNVKKSQINSFPQVNLGNANEFYLFVFSVKFQGYIVETQVSAVIIDKSGNEVKNLADYILNVENYDDLFQFDGNFPQSMDIDKHFIDDLRVKAKSMVKQKTSQWKQEIKILNSKIYHDEREKKNKLYSYNKKMLSLKLESLSKKLEKKVNQKPSDQRKQKILRIEDESKKREKLERFESLTLEFDEEIEHLKKDIDAIKKKLDDLSFQHEDLKSDMRKRNLAKFYTNILGFAVLKIVE